MTFFREKEMSVLAIITDNSKTEGKKTYKHKEMKWEKDVSFPIYGKVSVNGNTTHPIYRFLKTNSTLYNTNTKRCLQLSNFGHMFLLDQDGNVVKDYKPSTSVQTVLKDVARIH